MAKKLVRNASFFGPGGRKWGEATSGTFDQESGNDLQVGDGEVIGISVGVKTSTLSVSSILTFDGSNVAKRLQDAYDNNQFIDMQIGLVNGEIHSGTMTVQKINVKTTMKNGELTGDFTLIGGATKRVG